MPIYEYDCPGCGHIEAFQSIKDAPLTRCPTCRRKVTKLVSQSSFQLKGTGWYVTDYAGKGRSGPAKDTSSQATSDSSGSESSSSDASKTGKKAEPKTGGSTGTKAA
jgi:putative FmdB family regulatory protein